MHPVTKFPVFGEVLVRVTEENVLRSLGEAQFTEVFAYTPFPNNVTFPVNFNEYVVEEFAYRKSCDCEWFRGTKLRCYRNRSYIPYLGHSNQQGSLHVDSHGVDAPSIQVHGLRLRLILFY